MLVCVDVEPMEQRLIEKAAGRVACDAVQVARVGEQVEDGCQGRTAGVEVGMFGAGELCFEAGAFVSDAA
ncbi:hypothetical protein ACWENQ_39765 [Nonomuraea sp. NPDC004354]